jgi:hypothetical protein
VFNSIIFAALCVYWCIICFRSIHDYRDDDDDNDDLIERSTKMRRIETTDKPRFFTSDSKLIVF